MRGLNAHSALKEQASPRAAPGEDGGFTRFERLAREPRLQECKPAYKQSAGRPPLRGNVIPQQ
jgi:hypothetical protein